MGIDNGYTPADVSRMLGTWAELRSRLERYGLVNDDESGEVLDLERALRCLASPVSRDDPRRYDSHEAPALRRFEKDAARAAAMIGAQLMVGFRATHDLRFAFGGTDDRNARLLERARAWLAVFLSGGSLDDAEDAFRA